MTISSSYGSYLTYDSNVALTLGQPKTPDDKAIARKRMETVDGNGNGAIGQAEFTAIAESGESSPLTYDASPEAVFNALDGNGDGSMSMEELTSALQGMGPSGGGEVGAMPPPPPAGGGASNDSEESSSTEGIYDPLDTNQDGIISAAEYAVGLNNLDEVKTEVTEATRLSADLFQKMLAYYGDSATVEGSSSPLLNINV